MRCLENFITVLASTRCIGGKRLEDAQLSAIYVISWLRASLTIYLSEGLQQKKILLLGLIPVSRKFYVRKFTFADKIEAMHERSLVSVEVETRLTSRVISALFMLPLFYLRD